MSEESIFNAEIANSSPVEAILSKVDTSQEERDRQFLARFNGEWEKTKAIRPRLADPASFVRERIGVKGMYQPLLVENLFDPQIRQQIDKDLLPVVESLDQMPDMVRRLISNSLSIDKTKTQTFGRLVSLKQRCDRINRLKDGRLPQDIDTSIKVTIKKVLLNDIARSLSQPDLSMDAIVAKYRSNGIVDPDFVLKGEVMGLPVSIWETLSKLLSEQEDWNFTEANFASIQHMVQKRDELKKYGFLGKVNEDFNDILADNLTPRFTMRAFQLTENLQNDLNLDSGLVREVSQKLYKFLDYARRQGVLKPQQYVEAEKALAYQLQAKIKKEGAMPWNKKPPTQDRILNELRVQHFSTISDEKELGELLVFYEKVELSADELSSIREAAIARRAAIQALRTD